MRRAMLEASSGWRIGRRRRGPPRRRARATWSATSRAGDQGGGRGGRAEPRLGVSTGMSWSRKADREATAVHDTPALAVTCRSCVGMYQPDGGPMAAAPAQICEQDAVSGQRRQRDAAEADGEGGQDRPRRKRAGQQASGRAGRGSFQAVSGGQFAARASPRDQAGIAA